MTASLDAGPAPGRGHRGWTTRFTLAWFGLWMAYLVPIQLALPDQLDALDHPHRVRDFGLINGLIGFAALITLPLFGALCDRTRSRFGRRRLWMVAGARGVRGRAGRHRAADRLGRRGAGWLSPRSGSTWPPPG